MAKPKLKILYMGEDVSETFDEPDAVALEDYFAPVTLSGKAIDNCSKIVPEDEWKPIGIHTWLSGRANAAFRKLPTSQKEIAGKGLKYVFEFDHTGPVLANVIRI